jgi:hypothetical protein
LRKLHASKGSRNALKGLDYDAVKLLRMDFLPPVFNGDVVFELPPVGSFVENLQAKLMVGMDKRQMDMPGPKLLHHTSRMIWA